LPFRSPPIRVGVPALLAALIALATSSTAAHATTCDRVASPTGSDTAAGTLSGPFKTAQRLSDSLTAGQTGCLRAGTYTQSQLTFRQAGAAGAPITFTSYPGERATLKGGFVYVPSGSNYVTISNVDIDGTASTQNTVQIMAADVILEDSDVTNGNTRVCVILGSNGGYGQSVRTTIQRNKIHNCGDPAAGNQHHAIYFENSVDGRVVDNLFWGTSAWAIHLYPNAQRTLVAHNVIDDNGRGVIFAGDSSHASSNNTIEQNLITNSTVEYNIQAWWGGPVGTNNIAQKNCVYNGKLGNIATQAGFSANANTVANPGYADAAAHDYRLASASPCLATVGYDTAAKLAGGTGAVPPPTPADTTPPVVAFRTLVTGQTVSGMLSEVAGNCEVTASDNVGVSRVEFFLDGAPLNVEQFAPYACHWDTTTAADGQHTLKAVGTDAAGNAAGVSVQVTVKNSVVVINDPPLVQLTSPAQGSTFMKVVTVTANASDDKGVARVEFYIDGALKATDTAAPYGYTWSPSRKVPYGPHTFTAKAYDAEGLSASASRTATRVR
jgi:hypothetical protein